MKFNSNPFYGNLLIEPLSAFSDNYIWLIIDPKTSNCTVVDPGDANVVINDLIKRNLTLTSILVTHHHFDHTSGISQLIDAFNPKVYGPSHSNINTITHPVYENDTINLLNYSFKVICTPGHTLDHIVFYCAELSVIFVGDCLFSGGCGRLLEGNAPQMLHSLNKLKALPDNTKIFAAHEYTEKNLQFAHLIEPNNEDLHTYSQQTYKTRQLNLPTLPATLCTEKKINPFLRTDKKTVINAIQKKTKCLKDIPKSEVFKELRQWKDTL